MNIKNFINTIDTVTEGGSTRVITSGLPVLKGKSIHEKMLLFKEKFEAIRKLLMLEPAGYQGMFGAVLTEPVNENADIGVFFLTSSGYLTMCVHSALGVATAMLETGMFTQPEPGAPLKLDTPAGIIALKPNFIKDQLSSISIQTNPAFVYKKDVILELEDKKTVTINLVFSAVFFVLLDVKSIDVKLSHENIPELKELGVKILQLANEQFKFSYPDKTDKYYAELVILFEDMGEAHARNAVISRQGDLDRSPCGAGTGARMAHLYSMNKLKLNQIFINESVFDTRFNGKIIKNSLIGDYQAVVPEITGSAYITGFHQFIK